MYLLTAFISKTDKVPELIHEIKLHGFTGGTVCDGAGFKNALLAIPDIPMVASMQMIFDEEGHMNKVLLVVVQTMDEVERLTELIESVIGDLDQPDTGLVIAQKTDFIKGFKLWPKTDL